MELKGLREVRFVRRVSQTALAVKTGIHQSKISRIENGLVKAREDEKKRLAKALRKPVKILFPTKLRKKRSSEVTVLTGVLNEG